MDVARVEGRSNLVEVAVDETLGPCGDGLGLGALFGSLGHSLNKGGAQGGSNSQVKSWGAQGLLRYSRWSPRSYLSTIKTEISGWRRQRETVRDASAAVREHSKALRHRCWRTLFMSRNTVSDMSLG